MSDQRRYKGFEPAGALLRAPIRKASEDRGFAVARLLTHWAEVAGPELAAITRPEKVSHSEKSFGATLTLLVKGAAAVLVEPQLPALRERVNATYGYNAIQKIRLTQTSAQGFATSASPLPEPAPNDPRASAMASDVSDANLREALEALGNSVLSRAKQKGL